VAIGSMNAKTKVATIECSTCAALLEVYPQNVPGEPGLGWDVLDDAEPVQSTAPKTLSTRPRRDQAAVSRCRCVADCAARARAVGTRSVRARPLNAVGELVEFVGDMLKELAALNAVHFFGRTPKQHRPLPVILRPG
jgi:hypothetical protein